MSEYDVVFYAHWIHSSCMHKYLALHNRLKSKCKVLTIMNEGEFGISKEQFSMYRDEDKEGVVLLPMSESLEMLESIDFKVGLFTSNGRKGWVLEGENPPALGKRDIEIAKKKGAISVQISEMMTDFYYAGADIASLISPLTVDWHVRRGDHRFQWRPYDANPQPKYMFSNCLLWDNMEECLPYKLTRNQFCDKYNLNPEKDFHVWLPDTIAHLFWKTQQAKHYQEIYKKVCSLDNVVTKLHPHDYKGLQYFKFGDKHSTELLGCEQTPVIDPIDTHWCYKYASCGISFQSSVSVEFLAYRVPFLYIDVEKANMPWKRLFTSLAHRRSLPEVSNFINNRHYLMPIEGLRDFYETEILYDKDKKALDLLDEQVMILLEKGLE